MAGELRREGEQELEEREKRGAGGARRVLGGELKGLEGSWKAGEGKLEERVV